MHEILGIRAKKKEINSLYKTLKYISNNDLELMFPNIRNAMSILPRIQVTSASVARANSALRFIKTDFKSTMSDNHFKALVLLYANWNIKLNYNLIMQMCANKYPHRALLINALVES